MYLTQPGEQLVNCGSAADGIAVDQRAVAAAASSSVPSSMIVRSAAKLVSNTLSKPQPPQGGVQLEGQRACPAAARNTRRWPPAGWGRSG